jgi:hypothetical protein
MLFAEMISIRHHIMADAFDNLPKAERLEKAVQACRQDLQINSEKSW